MVTMLNLTPGDRDVKRRTSCCRRRRRRRRFVVGRFFVFEEYLHRHMVSQLPHCISKLTPLHERDWCLTLILSISLASTVEVFDHRDTDERDVSTD